MATKLWVGGTSGSANDASVAGNWSPSGVPASSDDVYMDGAVSNYDITAGLDQSAKTYASLHVMDSFTGYIGSATAPYQCGATDVHLHEFSGLADQTGSRRLNLDFGSVATEVKIYGSASSGVDTGTQPISIIGTHASNTLYITGSAIVGIANRDASEAATFLSTQIGDGIDGGEPTVTFGFGCTLTTVEMSTGNVVNRDNQVTVLTMTGGEFRQLGAAAVITADVLGGVLHYMSDGTITLITIGNSGTLDMSHDARPKTITSCLMMTGAVLDLNNGNPLSVTITNGIDLVNCGMQDVTLRTWKDITAPNFTTI